MDFLKSEKGREVTTSDKGNPPNGESFILFAFFFFFQEKEKEARGLGASSPKYLPNLKRKLDKKQDTAVRPLKEQNDMDNRNLEKKGCKFGYEMGRTAVTGEQRSVFRRTVGKRFS